MAENNTQERILHNRYHLTELIGTGAMGQVYRAEDKLLGGVTVAVKFLSQTLLNDKMRKRFEREVTVSALLAEKNIHIIKVRDYGIDENDVPFYVMEFLEGQSLSDLIKLQPLPLKRFLSIARQICLGLDSAHIGIRFNGEEERCQVVHRDIKPSNIYIIQDRSLGEFIKILDFGIAKIIQADATQTSSFMGTLAYCSPEQMEGKELDNRSDIYSLGVMMYEMLTLQMPILPESSTFGSWYKAHRKSKPRPFESHLEIPESLKNIIIQCMAKSPSDRPQSVTEILKVIRDLESDQSISSLKTTNYHEPETLIASSHNQGNSTDSSLNLSLEEQKKDFLQWPTDKPIKKIVFPRVLSKMSGHFTGLWVMLDKQDIINRKSSTRYNYFLFLNIPHPMILWITVIYNQQFSARWLPCYLDLKTKIGQKVASTLAEIGSYRIFFFSLEEPTRCEHIMVSSIDSDQCQIMKEWIELSKDIPDIKQSHLSKQRLKDEFQKLKPQILQKLQQKQKN